MSARRSTACSNLSLSISPYAVPLDYVHSPCHTKAKKVVAKQCIIPWSVLM
jgi:hypothetical protein